MKKSPRTQLIEIEATINSKVIINTEIMTTDSANNHDAPVNQDCKKAVSDTERRQICLQLTFMGEPPTPDQPVVILSTAPDTLLAKHIAHYLVEEGLAACVNLSAESLSMYMWKGELHGTAEVALTIKTIGARVQDVANRLCELHLYEVPELLVLPVQGGSTAYINWLAENTKI